MSIGNYVDLYLGQIFVFGVLGAYIALLAAFAYIVWFNRATFGAWLRDILDARRGAAVLLLLVAAPLARAADPEPPLLALYAGRLVTVNIDGNGKLEQGEQLYVCRVVAAVPGPMGLRLGFRGDLTALSAIDPSSLDLSAARTAEGYAAASWSAKAGGVSFGPAVFGGALVPVTDAVSWRMKGAYGGGLRVGYGASWAYAFVGKDAASDEIAGDGASRMRLIVPFNFQPAPHGFWKYLGGQGEVVTGPGGRFRLAAVVQIPNPWAN